MVLLSLAGLREEEGRHEDEQFTLLSNVAIIDFFSFRFMDIIGPRPESLGRQETRAHAKARSTQN